MYKAMIFDLDGTLADTVESIATAGNKALEACGFEPRPIEEYKYFAGNGADTLIHRALQAAGDTADANYEKAYQIYKEFFKTDCTYKVKPFPGICELLKEAKERGIKLAVISNKPHENTKKVVYTLFGTETFDLVFGQRDQVPKKPDPFAVLEAAKEFGVQPEECMYIGDTNVDMMTGKAARMYTVGVLWGFRDREELEKNHADRIVERPRELLSI